MTRRAYDAIKNKKRSVRLQDSFFLSNVGRWDGCKTKTNNIM